jgi:putative FmdB family regulatory protein
MPLYEYQCQSCGKKFEVLQKFSDAPLTVHEECGGEVERLVSAPAFHLKGTGWYATDYAKSAGPSTTPKNDDAKPAAENKPAATESKPDSGAPSTPAPTPST